MAVVSPMCLSDQYSIEPNSGCWLWLGAVSGGYGRKFHKGAVQQAHRVSYEIHVKSIDAGMVIDHKCRNKLCVNPAHLEEVTQSENCKRGNAGRAVSQINLAKTCCPHGHALDGKRNNGVRYCKTCHRQREAARRMAA